MLTHDREDTKSPTGRGLVDTSFAAHPSGAAFPGDIDKVMKPLSIAFGDEDTVFPIKQCQQAQQVLGGKSHISTELVTYPGARHGFAVRAIDQYLIARTPDRLERPKNKRLHDSRSNMLPLTVEYSLLVLHCNVTCFALGGVTSNIGGPAISVTSTSPRNSLATTLHLSTT